MLVDGSLSADEAVIADPSGSQPGGRQEQRRSMRRRLASVLDRARVEGGQGSAGRRP